ncbi:hypothetical protein [Halomonas denitrificans]|nr:hypothetical protein [Halomonas denitrificans]
MRIAWCMAILFWSIGQSAFADGRFEIHQLCVPIGCFEGDAPGFPVTIDRSGSYRLTSNIEVPLGANGILIPPGSFEVSLDFGGHALIGPTRCTGNLPSCDPLSVGEGIIAIDSGQLTVFNGAVTGFPENGIVATNLWLTDMRIAHNGLRGARVYGDGQIDSALFLNNGGTGAWTNTSFVIRNSVFANNGGTGVSSGVCSGNSFRSNGSGGMIPEQLCSNFGDTNFCNGSAC